jgi:DNA-binding beta-propeller fold protein YncE
MDRLFRFIICILVTMMFLCACAPAGPAVKRRLFWPTPPNEPRIEWVGAYSSKQDLREEGPSLFNTIVGEDEGFQLEGPLAIASDGKGRTYVSDSGPATAYVFDFTSRDVSVLGGEALSASIRHMTGISVDARGNAYVADASSRKIYVVDRDNKLVKVLDLSAFTKNIAMFAIDKRSNRLIVPDVRDHKIVVTDLEGKHLFTFGRKGDGEGEFNMPTAVAIEADGGILVCDSFNARIQRFTPQGVFVNKFGKRGDGIGDFSIIKGVAVDSEGHIYVTDGKDSKVSIFSKSGETLMVFGNKYSQMSDELTAAAGFLVPQGIYIDDNDRIYIADQRNRRFQVFQYLNAGYLAKFPITVKPADGSVK